jgi:hypothetical protein
MFVHRLQKMLFSRQSLQDFLYQQSFSVGGEEKPRKIVCVASGVEKMHRDTGLRCEGAPAEVP